MSTKKKGKLIIHIGVLIFKKMEKGNDHLKSNVGETYGVSSDNYFFYL